MKKSIDNTLGARVSYNTDDTPAPSLSKSIKDEAMVEDDSDGDNDRMEISS